MHPRSRPPRGQRAVDLNTLPGGAFVDGPALSETLGVSDQTLRRYRARTVDPLPAVRMSVRGPWRHPVAPVRAWLRRNWPSGKATAAAPPWPGDEGLVEAEI